MKCGKKISANAHIPLPPPIRATSSNSPSMIGVRGALRSTCSGLTLVRELGDGAFNGKSISNLFCDTSV